MELYEQSAARLAELLRAGQASAVEIARSVLGRIEKRQDRIGAFLRLDAEQMLAQAAAADRRIAQRKPLPPLAGIPVGLKDNICTKGTVTSCASRMLETFVPFYDATVVEKLRGAGAVLAGKLNMDEFAMGSSCEYSYFGVTRNPRDTSRVPGGSSGGSAAAVADCQLPLALGSDTGGSIRCPAAYCGVVGLKPGYGAVSRYGLVAFASSLEQIGPLGRTVEDVALLFGAICGRDSRDATTKPVAFAGLEREGLRGKVLGLPKEYFAAGIDADVQVVIAKAVETMEEQGATVREVSLPMSRHALAAYYIISSAEAASNLARYDGVKYGHSAGRGKGHQALVETSRGEGFGPEVKRRILLGIHVLRSGYYDAYYKRAKAAQRAIARDFEAAFAICDVLVTPTMPTTAFALGEKKDDPTGLYAADLCTVPANLAGLPAVSVPAGTGSDGLPVGMQLMGPEGSEAMLLGAAADYEQAVGGFL